MRYRSKFLVLILLFVSVSAGPLFSATYPLDKNTVNSFDRLTMQPYSKGLSVASDITAVSTAATAAVMLALPSSEYFTVGVIYAETVGLTFGINEILKRAVPRERPYLYFEGYPEEDLKNGDYNESFCSRHTSVAFSVAAANTYIFSKYYPDSKWKIPVIAASYSLATITGILRVASGEHFASDVLVGALLGTAMGFVIPALHTLFADKNVEASVSPFGLAFKIGL